MVAWSRSPRRTRARPSSRRASTPSRPSRAESARATTSAASPAAWRTSPRTSRSRPSWASTGRRTAHGRVSRATSVGSHVGSIPRSSVSASSPTRSSASRRASSTTARAAATASAMRPCSSAMRARRVRSGEVDPALVARRTCQHGVADRLGGLCEAALRDVDVGERAGGLAADGSVGVELAAPAWPRPRRAACRPRRGASRRGWRRSWPAAPRGWVPTRRARRHGRAARARRRSRASPRPRSRHAGRPAPRCSGGPSPLLRAPSRISTASRARIEV